MWYLRLYMKMIVRIFNLTFQLIKLRFMKMEC